MTLLASAPLPLSLLLVLTAGLTAQERIERTIPVAGDASIRITNLAGTIRVRGWNRDSISVTATIPPGGGSFFLGGRDRIAKLGVYTAGDTLGAPGSSLDVRVPRRAKVWVKSISAPVEVSEFVGELDFLSGSGSLRVEGTPLRGITAESLEGDIVVIGSAGYTRIRSGTGRVTLTHARNDVSVITVEGAVVLEDANLAHAHLETVSGPVTCEGKVEAAGTLDVQTHSGDVDLSLPSDFRAEFSLQSLAGTVASAIGPKTALPPKGRPLQFQVGGGGSQITVRSFKGRIRVLTH